MLAKTPVILDTDIGDDIDDSWALVMLLKSYELDPKLITTTFGKAEYRAKLIAKMLTVAGRTDIPIGLGEGGHGGNGQLQPWIENFKLADYHGKVHQDGATAIIDLIDHSAEPITVISIGPSQTLAAVIKRRPDLPAKAYFVGMQGSVFKGYDGEKPSAEWNVKCDVKAAQTVLSAPWKRITITPLDTCGQMTLSGKRFEAIAASRDPLVQALMESYRIWSGKKRIDELHASSVLYDTVALYLAYAQRPEVKLQTLSIKVTDQGMTQVDPRGVKMSVATDWADRAAYYDRLVKIITQ